MSTLDEKIISELSKYTKPVKYSEIREKFKDLDFLDRFCFLITTGDVVIFGSGNEECKYPEEAIKINVIQQQFDPKARKSIRIDDIKKYAYNLLTIGREPDFSQMEDMNKRHEPFIFYKPNWSKLMEYLRGEQRNNP